MSNSNLTQIDNWLRSIGVSDLALESMNLDRWQKVMEKHIELEEQAQALVKSLKFYSKKEYDRVCFMDHSTCCETYGADARQVLEAYEAWKGGK